MPDPFGRHSRPNGCCDDGSSQPSRSQLRRMAVQEDAAGPQRVSDEPGTADEFEEYLRGAMRDPSFRAAYEAASRRAGSTGPLAAGGRAYRRRQQARVRRKRGLPGRESRHRRRGLAR